MDLANLGDLVSDRSALVTSTLSTTDQDTVDILIFEVLATIPAANRVFVVKLKVVWVAVLLDLLTVLFLLFPAGVTTLRSVALV